MLIPSTAWFACLLGSASLQRRSGPATPRCQIGCSSSELSSLPALGAHGALLKGEARAAERGKSAFRSRPDARVRLFALYGVADSAIAMRKWASSAPDWLEVRVLELPGHGYRSDEPLPPCSERAREAVDGAELVRQRSAWICSLADEIIEVQACTLDAKAPAPFAFVGFSFGALVAYELVREIARRGSQPPLALFALGRGAPHAVTLSTRRIRELQRYDDEAVLSYQKALGFDSDKIAPSMRPRAASLFRAGCLLGAVHIGDPYDTDGVPNLWDNIRQPMPHASGVPGVDCHVYGITAERDICWPPSLVRRWRDVPSRGYEDFELPDTAHEQLRNSPDAMAFVFERLASLAEEQATNAKRLAEILAVVTLGEL